MISSLRNQRTLARDASIRVKYVSRLPRRLTVQLLWFSVVVLLINGWCDQALAQSSTRSDPGNWSSLGSPAVENRSSYNSPLAGLRQPDPSNLLTESPAIPQVAGNTKYSHGQHRNDPTLVLGLSQPDLRHRQLYFEDGLIERGNVSRRFPNVTAGAEFFKSLLVFPIRLVTGK